MVHMCGTRAVGKSGIIRSSMQRVIAVWGNGESTWEFVCRHLARVSSGLARLRGNCFRMVCAALIIRDGSTLELLTTQQPNDCTIFVYQY